MLVGRRIHQQARTAQQGIFQTPRHRQQEQDVNIIRDSQRRDEVLGRGGLEAEFFGQKKQVLVVDDVLCDARVVAASQDEADRGSGVFWEAGKGADSEVDVLLRFEAVDGEDDIGVLPGKGVVVCGLRGLVRDVDAGVYDGEGAGGGEGGPLRRDYRFGEGGVDGDGGGEGHAPFFPGVEGEAVERFVPFLSAFGEEEVGEVAVEEGADCGVEGLEEREAGGELVGEKDGGFEGGEFGGEADLEDEVDLAQDGAEDGEAGEDRGRDYCVPPDADIECAYSYKFLYL